MQNIIQIVNELRNPPDYFKICFEEEDTLKKCILCKKYLSSNRWSVLMENHLKKKFNIQSPNDNISGDGCSKTLKKNIEIKVSLGAEDGSFNFVQLRPDHKLDYYLLLAYHLQDGEIGKLYWFLCSPIELYKLLPDYGSYAHGTLEKLGKITNENIYGRNCEYALRPNPNKGTNCKGKQLWDLLVRLFQVNEDEILKKI